MDHNSTLVSEAFTKQSSHFDQLNAENPLTDHLRTRFRQEVCRWLPQKAEILELNGGTGLDAIYFAELGHHLLVTDNAPGMLEKLDEKIRLNTFSGSIKTKRLSFHELDKLGGQKFDHIISNFGGLNCTGDLRQVLDNLPQYLKPNGKVTLVIMPVVCPWELLQAFKGKFKTAFRRWGRYAPANVEGTRFNCFYYNPSYIKKFTKNNFRVLSLTGIFITVPPEFYQRFVERYPRLYAALSRIDDSISGIFPFNRFCDHYMITLEKR